MTQSTEQDAAMTQSTRHVTVAQCDDGEAWNAFVERTDGSPFALWGWGEAIASYGLDRHYLVAKAGDAIVGALPLVHVDSRLFGDTLVSLPYTSQGALVTDDDHEEAATRRLLDAARDLGDDLGVDAVTVRSTDLGAYPNVTTRNRYVSFRVPVDESPADVRSNVKKSRRRAIRQAEDDDALEYDVGDSLDDLREFYRLYLQSMQGHGTPPHAFEFFRILWDRLHDDGHLRLGLVRTDGQAINAMLDLALGSTVIQKSVVLDYEYRDRNGGSLLHWKSLEWASEASYDYYHLGRTRPDSGVYRFKRTWGGEEVDLVDTHYFPDDPFELPDAEDETFDLPKRVWRKLPLAVARAIGPHIRKNITL